LDFILSLGGLVDWVALSFVQKPSDMEEFRQLAGDKIKLMAKLEKPSAIDSLEEVRCCWGFCQRCRAVLWWWVFFVGLGRTGRPCGVVFAGQRGQTSGSSGVIFRAHPVLAVTLRVELCVLQIVALSDGVMVARGDLGVEMNPWDVPVLQKRIVETCKFLGKPVVSVHFL
jgi:hypothetical protein